VKIWRKRSEWDYSWISVLESPAEIILCSIYEYSRYALLSLPERIPFQDKDCLLAVLRHLSRANTRGIESIGPILFLGIYLSARGNFPLDLYRVARRVVRLDPEAFLRRLDAFPHASGYQHIRVPTDATKAKALQILAARRKRGGSLSGPKRGAGSRIRQAKTAHKNLGALKLLQSMSAPEAIEYTRKILGRPLFITESQWSRARRAAEQMLRPYHVEAAVLLRIVKKNFGKSYVDAPWGDERFSSGKVSV
jgi:hypothetical protein